MIIHFWGNTFWAKNSLSFLFRVPNSVHPEVPGMPIAMIQVSKLYDDLHFWENTFWAKTSPFLWFRKLSTPRSYQAWQWYNMIHFSENTLFTFLSIEGQTQHTLKLSGMPIAMVQVSKLYDDPFLRKHILGYKHHFPFNLEGQTQHTLMLSGMPFAMVQVWKHCMMIHFWENTFWAKTSPLLSYLEGQTQHNPEVFRHANCNDTSFKAVWWSISEKTHFGLKHHFPSYLEGQTQHTLNYQACHCNGTSLKDVW